MKQLSVRIEQLFKNSSEILLHKGGPYRFLKKTSTKINGKVYDNAFEYQISEKNNKRVTIELIDFLYKNHQQFGRFVERTELKAVFKTELKSRPCNYSVAKFIVNRLIKEDHLNK